MQHAAMHDRIRIGGCLRDRGNKRGPNRSNFASTGEEVNSCVAEDPFLIQHYALFTSVHPHVILTASYEKGNRYLCMNLTINMVRNKIKIVIKAPASTFTVAQAITAYSSPRPVKSHAIEIK